MLRPFSKFSSETYRLNFEEGLVPFLFWGETLDGRQQFGVGFVEMGVRQVHRSLCNKSRMNSKLIYVMIEIGTAFDRQKNPKQF
jgi:hypothetical protein